jgi:hypothetical protein
MEFKKLALGFSPTPIHELSNLSNLLEGYGLQLFLIDTI